MGSADPYELLPKSGDLRRANELHKRSGKGSSYVEISVTSRRHGIYEKVKKISLAG